MQKSSVTLKELASLVGGELVGDPECLIEGVADLSKAGANEISFLENPRYKRQLERTKAGAVVLSPKIDRPSNGNFLLHETPSLAFQSILEHFIPDSLGASGFTGIHSTAVVHSSASIAESATIGPYAVIDRDVVIGERVHIGAHVSIQAAVTIGDDCKLHAHSVVRERCILKNRVVLQPGAVIGSDGYGYHTDAKGKHTFLPQRGIVVLEDNVEIGANTTIDRARFEATKIGAGTKVDNLVQIAHQVELGKDNLIVSQVGIAGSSKTGDRVIMGGQAALVGHIEIADDVILCARAAGIQSIKSPGVYSGAPARTIREFNQTLVHQLNAKKYAERLKKLEKRLDELEAKKKPGTPGH